MSAQLTKVEVFNPVAQGEQVAGNEYTAKTIMTLKIRFETFRNYNDLDVNNRLCLFKYLIKQKKLKIYIQIDRNK